MQCSPSFDCNWANKTIPLHVGTSYTHDIGFHCKRNVSAAQQIAWAGSLSPQTAWAARGLCTFEPPLMGGHPPLKFPPYSLLRAKGGRKTINFFSHFHGLIPDTIYEHLDWFVMIGTHSELRRGQMSHICDISPLRVKLGKYYLANIHNNYYPTGVIARYV